MSLTKPRTPKKAINKQASGNPALDLFHRQWQELEKRQAKQAKKETEHGDIYRRFQAEIEPLERQQCQLTYQLTERLIGFTARKSLTGWQRDMLHDWLHENITYLESNPFRGEMELEPLYCQIQSNTATHLDEETLDQQCDFIAQMLTEACGQCPDDPAVLREMVKDPEKLREYLLQIASEREAARASAQDDPDAEEELFTEDGYFYQEHEHDAFAHARASRDQEEVARLTPLFNKSSLKHLYRKLALALHPDREQDPAKREEKTRIMGQLSHAWEHKDMFTLLQLAHTHLPESKDLLSEENLAFINPLLKRRINELILSGFQGPDGLLGAVVNRFKQSSKKKTELAFTEHHDYLVRDIESLTAQLAKITTLQTLKPFLAARWDEQQQAQWDDEPELDWMFR